MGKGLGGESGCQGVVRCRQVPLTADRNVGTAVCGLQSGASRLRADFLVGLIILIIYDIITLACQLCCLVPITLSHTHNASGSELIL